MKRTQAGRQPGEGVEGVEGGDGEGGGGKEAEPRSIHAEIWKLVSPQTNHFTTEINYQCYFWRGGVALSDFADGTRRKGGGERAAVALGWRGCGGGGGVWVSAL